MTVGPEFRARTDGVAGEALECDLPPEVDRDLLEPPPLRKLVGLGVIAVGIGTATGEFILWPYITSIAGLGLLWLALVTLLAQVLYYLHLRGLMKRTSLLCVDDLPYFVRLGR